MRESTYRPREFVVELPDDGGISLDAIIGIMGGGGTTSWLGEWLLQLSDPVMAIHTRMRFPDLRVTQDGQLIVPSDDRHAIESWVSVQGRGQYAWMHLEVLTPWSLDAARAWGTAYSKILGKRPRIRSTGLWPQVFCRR